LHLAQSPIWRTTGCRLSGTAYSIYSQPRSVSEGRSSIRSQRTQIAVVTGTHLSGFYMHTYTVWQKSNETVFLLTMNFILFTNQGYPLQNSSLGQLHSDGGVVSIVRSGAGRLRLEYLSARPLRSSGYYPKYQNGALSSGF